MMVFNKLLTSNNSKKLFLIISFSVILILILFLSSCTIITNQESELTTIKVGLSWIHEAQFAGLYLADQYGYYQEEGIIVEFYPYNNSDLAQDLVDGNFDVVVLQTDTLLQARDNGLPVTAIFADYRKIPTVYFSKKEKGIIFLEDLIGKTVGVAYSERYPLVAMLNNKGIDVSEVNIVEREYNYDQLASGEFDLEAGWVTDIDLVEFAVGEYNMLHPYDYGVNWYADLITVTEDVIEENPELIKRFLRATSHGWQHAIENTDQASLLTNNYIKEHSDYQYDYPEGHLEFVLEVSSPLIHTGDAYLGWMEQAVFEDASQILSSQGIISSEGVNISQVSTTKFLEEIYGGEEYTYFR